MVTGRSTSGSENEPLGPRPGNTAHLGDVSRKPLRFLAPAAPNLAFFRRGIVIAFKSAGGTPMEEVFEYRSRLDGRVFWCLYKIVFSDRLGCYLFEMIPGSLRWSENGDKAN